MIEMVSRAEDFIARRRKAGRGRRRGAAPPTVAQVAPIVRGACSEKDDTIEGAWRRLVLEFRATDAVLEFHRRQGFGPLSAKPAW